MYPLHPQFMLGTIDKNNILNSKSNLVVREMSARDIKQARQIALENNLEDWTYDDYLNEINKEKAINLIAEIKEKTVGFLVSRLIILEKYDNYNSGQEIEHETIEAEIHNIGISEQYQGVGIGTLLLKNLLHKITLVKSSAASETIDLSIWLEVRKSNNNAINFYKKNNFELNYLRKNFYSNPIEDALVMQFNSIIKKNSQEENNERALPKFTCL